MKNCFILILTLIACQSIAQKPPNKQLVSLYAPSDIKIDGKTTEWNNHFQAYNSATGLFYTVSNDDQNIYFVVQANDIDVLTKVTLKGLIFNINTAAVKNDNMGISIIYPFYEKNKLPYIGFKRLPANLTLLQEDSLMNVRNKKLELAAKNIKVTGIPEIDTVISVYNEDGITARQAFNNSRFYTCELAVPLKYFKINALNSQKIYYHLLVPGISDTDFGLKMEMINGQMTLTSSPGSGEAIPPKDHYAATAATTDFWGEYTLAKKP